MTPSRAPAQIIINGERKVDKDIASSKADTILAKILDSQSEVLARSSFNSVENAEEAAEAVAAFRRRLIAKLTEQN